MEWSSKQKEFEKLLKMIEQANFDKVCFPDTNGRFFERAFSHIALGLEGYSTERISTWLKSLIELDQALLKTYKEPADASPTDDLDQLLGNLSGAYVEKSFDDLAHPVNDVIDFVSSHQLYVYKEKFSPEQPYQTHAHDFAMVGALILALVEIEAQKVESGLCTREEYVELNTNLLLELQRCAIYSSDKLQLLATDLYYVDESFDKAAKATSAASARHADTARIKEQYTTWYMNNLGTRKFSSKNQAAEKFHRELDHSDQRKIQPEALKRHLRKVLKESD
ncbi:hypothetical protein [Oleiphilus sp. HI0080]|uniref:hypothetical protein n=2 Tax=Oleiphilus sp. HI0080 TaxID=1822255 RepID=UPI0018D2B8D0|nr:hypothetical protein [Oleiphilus sp. HI0080]